MNTKEDKNITNSSVENKIYVEKMSNKVHINSLDEGAFLDVLDVMKFEFSSEREKKQSFESRSGLLLVLLAGLSVFFLQSISIKEILSLASQPLTFMKFIKIISGLTSYICFVICSYKMITIMFVQDYETLEVKNIDEDFLSENKYIIIMKLIKSYGIIIGDYKKKNNIKAKQLNHACGALIFMIISMILYISI